MDKKFSFLVLMCMFFLNACISPDDNVFIDTGIKATLPETIDAYLNTNLSSDEPGVSILVRKNGELIYKNVKGLANKSNRTLISHETGFRLASISKPL